MITNITFDVGDVLVMTNEFDRKLSLTAEKLGFKYRDFLARYLRWLPKLEANKGKISNLIPKPLDKEFVKIYEAVAGRLFHLNQPVFSLALKLKKDYQVGILSNIDRYLAQLKIHQDVYSKFDPKLVLLSYQYHLRKPDKEIYEIYLKKIGCRPENLLFIDNNPLNIPPAQKMGIHTILFQNYLQLKRDLISLKLLPKEEK